MLANLFKRVVHHVATPPTSYPTKKEIASIHCDINGLGNYDTEVVGESNYQKLIWMLMPAPESTALDQRRYFIFDLVLEDDNAFDKNAVAIKIGITVGYLPRDTAKTYRKFATANKLPTPATCRGVITGGGADKSFGIWLDIPIDS